MAVYLIRNILDFPVPVTFNRQRITLCFSLDSCFLQLPPECYISNDNHQMWGKLWEGIFPLTVHFGIDLKGDDYGKKCAWVNETEFFYNHLHSLQPSLAEWRDESPFPILLILKCHTLCMFLERKLGIYPQHFSGFNPSFFIMSCVAINRSHKQVGLRRIWLLTNCFFTPCYCLVVLSRKSVGHS